MNHVLRILVIEHDLGDARALARGLSRHRVIVEHSVPVATERLQAGEWFDVVVCEGSITGVNDVLSIAHSLPEPPLVVLLSDRDIGDARASAILAKPFAVDQLLEVIYCLKQARARARTRVLACMAAK